MSPSVFSVRSSFGGLSLGAAISVSLVGGCASPPEASDDDPGAIQGEIRAISVMGIPTADGSMAGPIEKSMIYELRVAGTEKDVPLEFDTDPHLESETIVRIWGHDVAGALHVDRMKVMEPETDPELDRLAIINGPVTNRTAAWVIMNVQGTGTNMTVAQGNELIFDRTNPGPLFGTTHNGTRDDRSLVQYYDEVSYGMMHLTGAVEPIDYASAVCPGGNPVFDQQGNAVRTQITNATGHTYDHYFLFWGVGQNCGGGGWGAQGTKTNPGRYVWLDNASFCTATAQEIGHNFGMMHASTTRCATGTTLSNNLSGCTSDEYGNRMTAMGMGCRHLNAIEKTYEGWLGGCNVVTVNSTQTFKLFPIEQPCNGIQALKIAFPSGASTRQTSTSQSNGNVTLRNYFLEYRNGTGLDNGLAQGVYVHLEAVPQPSSNGPRSFLLDMEPSTTGGNSFQAMSVGQTYSDPAGGVSFTVVSQDATSASVTVTVATSGNNTCADGSTLTGSGPTDCGSGPTGGMGGMGGSAGTGGMGGRAGGGAGGMGGRAGGGAGGMAGRAGAGAGGMNGGAGAGGGTNGGAGGVDGGVGGAAGGIGGAAGFDPGGSGGSGGAPGGAAGATTAGAAGVATGGATTGGTGPITGGTGPIMGGAGPAGAAGAAAGMTTTPPGGGSTPDTAGDDGGCGCRVVGTSSEQPTRTGSLALAALALGAVVARRRRRR